MHMGDDERRRNDFKSEQTAYSGLLDSFSRDGTLRLPGQICFDATQDLGQECPGAAARIQHIHVVRRQSQRDFQIVFQRIVDARHHVLHYLFRCVPNPHLLAQLGIEGFQKRLVKVRYCIAFLEFREEQRFFNPVKCGCGPVQHFDKTEILQAIRIRDLTEQRSKHRCSQMPIGFSPSERSGIELTGLRQQIFRFSGLVRPQHPGRADAVEQCLNQCRMKEVRSLRAFETHPQCNFQC